MTERSLGRDWSDMLNLAREKPPWLHFIVSLVLDPIMQPSLIHYLKYVDIIQFAFHVLQFLPIISTKKLMLHQQIYNETSTQIGLGIEPTLIQLRSSKSACFVDFLTEYINTPICMHY